MYLVFSRDVLSVAQLTTYQNKSLICPGNVFIVTRDSGYISTCSLRECDLDLMYERKYCSDIFEKLKNFRLEFLHVTF